MWCTSIVARVPWVTKELHRGNRRRKKNLPLSCHGSRVMADVCCALLSSTRVPNHQSPFTSTVRERSSPFQNATWTSIISRSSSKTNSISHDSPSGTRPCAQDHLDSMSLLTPSRDSSGAHPSSPRPTSPLASPGRVSYALANAVMVVLVLART